MIRRKEAVALRSFVLLAFQTAVYRQLVPIVDIMLVWNRYC